jgi:hypothetical protein
VQATLRAELDAVRSVQSESPPDASRPAPAAKEEPARDSGLDDDLVLDDIPSPAESSDTGDFELGDDEEEEPSSADTGETMVLSLDDAEDAVAVEEVKPDEPEPAPEEPATAAEEVRGEALPKGDPVSCTACDAMGSCRRCGGRGKRFGRRCAECNGSGTCSVCGGPGYIWVEEPVAERAG